MKTGLTEDNLKKSFREFDIEKGKRTGIYLDTPTNRAKHRVGQKYSKDKKEEDGGFSNGQKSPGDKEISPKVVEGSGKWDKKLNEAIGKYSNDPDLPGGADDFILDVARGTREAYNEFILDVTSDDPEYVESETDFRHLTKTNFNRAAIKQIQKFWPKLNDGAKEHVLKYSISVEL